MQPGIKVYRSVRICEEIDTIGDKTGRSMVCFDFLFFN